MQGEHNAKHLRLRDVPPAPRPGPTLSAPPNEQMPPREPGLGFELEIGRGWDQWFGRVKSSSWGGERMKVKTN